jgi:hypothetical protein
MAYHFGEEIWRGVREKLENEKETKRKRKDEGQIEIIRGEL